MTEIVESHRALLLSCHRGAGSDASRHFHEPPCIVPESDCSVDIELVIVRIPKVDQYGNDVTKEITVPAINRRTHASGERAWPRRTPRATHPVIAPRVGAKLRRA